MTTEAKCLECAASMRERREDFRYDASGLPVTLLAVVVRRCTACREAEVQIPMIEALHAALADALLGKRGRYVGAEIRFLRSWLGLSGRRLASWLGVQPETVSRWEHDRGPIGDTHERLLRLIAARKRYYVDYDIASFLEARDDREKAKAARIQAKATDHSWTAELAA
jgi:putative zinc finger/helix-turn-helix YgiT family protein